MKIVWKLSCYRKIINAKVLQINVNNFVVWWKIPQGKEINNSKRVNEEKKLLQSRAHDSL